MRKAKTVAIIGVLLAVLAAPVQAGVVTNESVDVNIAAFVPCANGGAGEFVVLSGRLHVLTTLTINGNNFSGKTHFQPLVRCYWRGVSPAEFRQSMCQVLVGPSEFLTIPRNHPFLTLPRPVSKNGRPRVLGMCRDSNHY